MRLDYNVLKKIGRETRMELIERGEIDPGRRRIRRKPRDAEKIDLIYRMTLDRLEQYPPYRDEKGRLVLPYFKIQ
jgi:hypothetical protein